MSARQCHVKEIIINGCKESIGGHAKPTSGQGESHMDGCSQSTGVDMLVSRNIPKSIKMFVENSLSNDIDSYLQDVVNVNKETWKIDAHNISKILLDQSNLSCFQDNLSNILDSCLKDVNKHSKHGNESDVDISPLLQPEHITEVAECISVEKPLDVRLNALQVLLKFHFTESITGHGWFLLQKKLVENLCESNIALFLTCLKVHAKLASCSSSGPIKECAINLLDGLGQHYFLQNCESKAVSLQNMHFYRLVHLTRLLLDTFRETTLNIARFGESKLDELIDNFVQLLSIHVSSKQSRNKPFFSPLEVVSYLDPYGKWLANITHFALSRRLFFSSLCKNISFLRITTEEILNWLNEPVIPSRNISKVLQGELNVAVYKQSLFCHSLSVFTNVCSFDIGCNLFPVNIKKQEVDLVSIEDVLEKLIVLLNDANFKDILYNSCTETFRTFISEVISKLLCLKQINGSSFLFMLLKKHENEESLTNPVKIEILNTVSQYKYCNNPLIRNKSLKKKSPSTFNHCFMKKINQNLKQRKDIECQSLVCFPIDENNEISPFEVYLKIAIKLQTVDLKKYPCLVKIMTNMFQYFDKLLGIAYAMKAQTTQFIAEIYLGLQESLKNPESTFDNNGMNLSFYCGQFLISLAVSPLGFYILQASSAVSYLLRDGLQSPIINWSDPIWLAFIFKATTTIEGCEVIASESNGIFKKELNQLWDIIEQDCSGSQKPIENKLNQLLRIVSLLGSNLSSIKALLNEHRDGSDITLMDDCDIRPSNLHFLLQHFALNTENCPDFIHHQFALSVLHILVSNIDSSLYLQHKLNYQDTLLQLQSDNRIDDNSEVIIDECSLLRQRIIDQTYLPGRLKSDTKPNHTAPRPESTLDRAKPRSRGTGEFARWLSETRLGLHDHSWVKHARHLYRNTWSEDMKGSTIIDLLEQVVKVLPETRSAIKWQEVPTGATLLTEDQLAVQLVLRYGAHHRLILPTQQNMDNLTRLILSVKTSLNQKSNTFKSFDWFVASVYLVCSGSVEKSQTFLSLVFSLPNVSVLWMRIGEPSILAQAGNIVETIISEEMPTLFQMLQKAGLSCWQLFCSWICQCWWNVLDWSQICHWFALTILHQLDHCLYFCVALLHINHDRWFKLVKEGTIHEIITNPIEKCQMADIRISIEKLQKKYHSILHPHLTFL